MLVKGFGNRWGRVAAMLGAALMPGVCRAAGAYADAQQGIVVAGPGVAPHLGFACCEHSIDSMQALFADPAVFASLRELHATVAIAILDFSPQRTAVVQRLNRQGIPVVAWILLPRDQGYYLTADNAPQAAERLADFRKWTSRKGLHWAAVGLDIEPDFAWLAQFRGHRWRLMAALLGRSLNGGRIERARIAYARLIDRIRADGYPVQVYQMPYVPAERSVHSTLPDRLLGTVDVRGDENYLMLYTSDARAVGAGMIWSLGTLAQAIAIGSTDGDAPPGLGRGPLDWEEFSRDLIVASHFTRQIGVYDLEGCVRQGFLPRLVAMNWSKPVVISAESARLAARLGFASRCVLWIVTNFLYLAAIGLLLIAWIVWRRRAEKPGQARPVQG